MQFGKRVLVTCAAAVAAAVALGALADAVPGALAGAVIALRAWCRW